ncbi:unnamed protein product, partial [Brassica rapa]
LIHGIEFRPDVWFVPLASGGRMVGVPSALNCSTSCRMEPERFHALAEPDASTPVIGMCLLFSLRLGCVFYVGSSESYLIFNHSNVLALNDG